MVEKETKVRTYQGNDPGLDWECIEVLDHEGMEWHLYRRQNEDTDWYSMKLTASKPVPRKANYWFGWNGVRANRSTDWLALTAGRAELHSKVLSFLKQA